MRKVIELGQLREIPESHIECSICGIYHPRESYCGEDKTTLSRTNCQSCYERPSSEWQALKEKKNSTKNSKEVIKYLEEEKAKNNGIKVSDLIAELSKLPKDAIIVITQDGYYSDGKYAEIFSCPERVNDFKEIPVFKIGHSSQGY